LDGREEEWCLSEHSSEKEKRQTQLRKQGSIAFEPTIMAN